MKDLHDAILKLPNLRRTRVGSGEEWGVGYAAGYDVGHSDARHAATEMVAAVPEQDDADVLAIREAITGYYLALDEREHAVVAMDRAFNKIEATLGMSWTRGETMAAKKVKNETK